MQLLFIHAPQTLRYSLGSIHRVARCSVREALAFLVTEARGDRAKSGSFGNADGYSSRIGRRLAASPCHRLDLRKDHHESHPERHHAPGPGSAEVLL